MWSSLDSHETILAPNAQKAIHNKSKVGYLLIGDEQVVEVRECHNFNNLFIIAGYLTLRNGFIHTPLRDLFVYCFETREIFFRRVIVAN